MMPRLFSRIRQWLGRKAPRPDGLTAIEYEAVSLIAYEGRAAYKRALEQAKYCRKCGSESGCEFWSEVAAEVARRSGLAKARRSKQPPR
jgi:hypothetical protein